MLMSVSWSTSKTRSGTLTGVFVYSLQVKSCSFKRGGTSPNVGLQNKIMSVFKSKSTSSTSSFRETTMTSKNDTGGSLCAALLQTWWFNVAEKLWARLGGVGSGRGVVPAQPAVPVAAAVRTYGTDVSETEAAAAAATWSENVGAPRRLPDRL